MHMDSLKLLIKKLPNLGDLPLPSYATNQSAGMDLVAAIHQDIVLKPLERKAIPTGISLALPEGYEAQIRPRSGLALKCGISMPNAPGTIDADYRGEVSAVLINLSNEDFVITRGMRIAQMVIAAYSKVTWTVVQELPETARGTGGFGSTGLESSIVSRKKS
jgi:dUTP pyrophosphatase